MGDRSVDWKRVIARERQLKDEIKKVEMDIASKKKELQDLQTAHRVISQLPELPEDLQSETAET